MRTLWTRILCFTLLAGGAASGEERVPKVLSYELDISFDPHRGAMEGWARVRFESVPEPPERLAFYLHGELSVESVRRGDKEIQFEEERVFYPFDYSLIANRVELGVEGWDTSEILTVLYRGSFHPSGARSPSDYMRIDPSGVFLRSYGYSLWFPVFLDSGQDTYDVSFPKVVLRTPPEYRSVFVGRKLRDFAEGGRRVTEWSAESIDLFAAQSTAQRYSVLEQNGFSVYHYDDQHSIDGACAILNLSVRLNGFYQTHYRAGAMAGEVHILQMPEYGDISSGNVVGINTEAWSGLGPDSRSVRLLAHELVHSFVRVDVRRSDPMYALVVEGFPSYFHLPALAEILGEEIYETVLRRTEEAYLQNRASGVDRRGRNLPPEKPLLEIRADEIGVYKDVFVLSDRALLFFDDLRSRMGKERFLEFTRDLFQKESLDATVLEGLVSRYIPDAREDVRVWLSTTEYPERLQRSRRPPPSPAADPASRLESDRATGDAEGPNWAGLVCAMAVGSVGCAGHSPTDSSETP